MKLITKLYRSQQKSVQESLQSLREREMHNQYFLANIEVLIAWLLAVKDEVNGVVIAMEEKMEEKKGHKIAQK